jgi:hypothetical protein
MWAPFAEDGYQFAISFHDNSGHSQVLLQQERRTGREGMITTDLKITKRRSVQALAEGPRYDKRIDDEILATLPILLGVTNRNVWERNTVTN